MSRQPEVAPRQGVEQFCFWSVLGPMFVFPGTRQVFSRPNYAVTQKMSQSVRGGGLLRLETFHWG